MRAAPLPLGDPGPRGVPGHLLYRAALLAACVARGIVITRRHRLGRAIAEGFADHRCEFVPSSPDYAHIFDRILALYDRAAREGADVPRPYRVGRMWQDILERDFATLRTALARREVPLLRSVLENFHRDRSSYGLGGGTAIYAG